MPTRGPSNTAPQRTKRMASVDVTGGMTESADGSPPTFGQRLRAVRTAHGLTLQQVADAVGCTKAYIWELEMKDGQRPSAERIQAIAKVLGVTMEDVMGDTLDKVPQASPEDVQFFREYAGMTDEEKQRYRQALDLMFGSRKDEAGKA